MTDRKKPGPTPPDPERVARILVDADELGDERAGRRHHVAERTVQNYRAKYGGDPRVVELCATYKKALQADWLRRAKEVRRKTLRHLEATLQDANPYQLAGIFKTVHEGILANGVLTDDAEPGQDPEPGVEPPLSDDHGAPPPRSDGDDRPN